MEFYPKDDLDICFKKVDGESEIQNAYSGTHIFITGATGFVGKILLEKLLRTCNPAQVFILVRQKRGKSQAERLKDLLNDVVFERMLIENKKAREKIILMNGDCSLPNLGLSEDNTKILQNKIDFVFHCAATVNMGEHLRTAFNINISATRYLLEQAKTMTKLKTFVYVSTAYSQVMLSEIEEKFYTTEFSAEELDQIVNNLNDVQLSALTPILVGKMVNTYSLTKAVTEYMVSKYYPEVPVAVVRPSIVISTAMEPIAGWIDNIYGATGVNAGAYSGLLRVWRTDPKVLADLIPVDITINAILAVGWHVSIHKPISENNIVFNLVSSTKKPMTYQVYMDLCEKSCFNESIAYMMAVGSYNFRILESETLFWFYTMVLHVLPAIFFDCAMWLAKMEPKFLSAYRKVYKANVAISPYCTKEFKYKDDNVDKVWALMNAKDKLLFNFDMNVYTYEEYFRLYARGIRVYLLKDPMETLTEAKKRYFKFYYLAWVSKSLLLFFGGLLVYYIIFNVVPLIY